VDALLGQFNADDAPVPHDEINNLRFLANRDAGLEARDLQRAKKPWIANLGRFPALQRTDDLVGSGRGKPARGVSVVKNVGGSAVRQNSASARRRIRLRDSTVILGEEQIQLAASFVFRIHAGSGQEVGAKRGVLMEAFKLESRSDVGPMGIAGGENARPCPGRRAAANPAFEQGYPK
jgi:hypothetical protein